MGTAQFGIVWAAVWALRERLSPFGRNIGERLGICLESSHADLAARESQV